MHTVGTGPAGGLTGTIDEIGYLIDPNQHTAVIKGYVENPGKRIRAGQYVTATVSIPAPDRRGGDSDRFPGRRRQAEPGVRADRPVRHRFTMRRVQVASRFDRSVFVRRTSIPKAEQLTGTEAEEGLLPREPLRPGERVLRAGAVELKAATLELESRPPERPSDVERANESARC